SIVKGCDRKGDWARVEASIVVSLFRSGGETMAPIMVARNSVMSLGELRSLNALPVFRQCFQVFESKRWGEGRT
ncbi:hypothetical protein VSX64_10570, partial [Aurantimonas sp. C2-6-R+9]|uniref:hypothetical protein n=1 Tax=Aurantimonas sp. C2-6-R+9 TaxID=3114365 RepID=UPI002E19D562|nr:hypothetical protein [Aurantimonas sp. C2-6-R+9]